MVTDEERREVAARLRGERKGSLPEFIAKAAFGVDYAKGTDMLALPKRLADLVDRPTTHLTEDEDGRTCCASCGCSALYMSEASYCPDCGAEVVE